MGKFAADIFGKQNSLKRVHWKQAAALRFIYSDCPSKQQPHIFFGAAAYCGLYLCGCVRLRNVTCSRRLLICLEQMIHFKPQTTEPFCT